MPTCRGISLFHHRQARTASGCGSSRLGRPAIHFPARTTTDAAGTGRVVHVVLQVSERQRARSQFTVARIGAGNRTAHQIHVAGVDVVPAITGNQAALLANTLIAAAGPACTGVTVGIPRGTERHLHAATHLLEADACFSTEQFATAATAGQCRDRTGCLVRVGARCHALHLLQAIIGLTGRVHVVDQVDQRRLHPREHADLQVLVALRVVTAFVGGEQCRPDERAPAANAWREDAESSAERGVRQVHFNCCACKLRPPH